MKTIKTFVLLGLIAAALTALFFSCSNPLALGQRLDLEGPVVQFLSPAARKNVGVAFTVEGTVRDDTGVDKLLLKVEWDNNPLPRQWRYNKGKWEISNDYGSSWTPYNGAKYTGTDKEGMWEIYVELSENFEALVDGEYLFILQAWDTAGTSDDKSYRTRVLIIDKDPPYVEVFNPNLYHVSGLALPDSKLHKLDAILDTDIAARTNPANIGEFLVRDFQLQWQVNDNHDVWSIDLRFYDATVFIDEDESTDLPSNYIFRYYKNDINSLPEVLEPGSSVKPNGIIEVPALTSTASGNFDGGVWEIRNPLSEKTTIKVVALCLDAAGHDNITPIGSYTPQEKVLGCFIYWPKADDPWIEYSDMENIAFYEAAFIASGELNRKNFLDKNVFMIYPGRKIKASAYHAQGLQKVQYSLLSFNENTGTLGGVISNEYKEIWFNNPPRREGVYSTNFSWEFEPPPKSSYFVIRADAYAYDKNAPSVGKKSSVTYEALFRVQDISFPEFKGEPKPSAGEPLFMNIDSNGDIEITGIISDATSVDYLTMVWINPESRGYAAMSQLQYFRDQTYKGWAAAKRLGYTNPNNPASNDPGRPENFNPANAAKSEWESTEPVTGTGDNYPYDLNYPNKLWRIPVTFIGEDPETNRQEFSFSVKVKLTDINIGSGTYTAPATAGDAGQPRDRQPLISQVFLLRAENPDNKCEVITYAPQGDTRSPSLKIDNVTVVKSGVPQKEYYPNTYAVVDKFTGGETITINGKWLEDSADYLSIDTYFKPNLKVTLGGTTELTSITMTKGSSEADWDGTWQAVINVSASDTPPAGQIAASSLSDTLVVNALVKDFGGNNAEVGSSWLVQTDTLRLMRISSDVGDGTYNTTGLDGTGKIEFFLEFNKPVVLKNPTSNPTLTLNAGTNVTATYKSGQSTMNTRQYFEYTVQPGHDTVQKAEKYLNVTGISTAIQWTNATYPLYWTRGTGDSLEEVKVTTGQAHNGQKPAGYDFYACTLPTTTNKTAADYNFTLVAGKDIAIDTIAPAIENINSNTSGGDYSTGTRIDIIISFNEDVKIGATPPRLLLGVNNTRGDATAPNAQRVYTDSVTSDGSKSITFIYNVRNGDTTDASPITLEDYTGNITDLAGNPLALNAISSRNEKRLGGSAANAHIYIDTAAPPAPTLRLVNSSNANISNVINGINTVATTATGGKDLKTIYASDLFLIVEPSAGARQVSKLQYSVNNGISWTDADDINGNRFTFSSLEGRYTLIARQIDYAGNISVNSPSLSFIWDKGGNLLTRITSTSANGTYTHTTGRNSINITVQFRKPLSFAAGTPSVTINARSAPVTTTRPSVPADSLSFTYTVANGDAASRLTVSNFTGLTDVRDSDGVAVLNNLGGIPAAGSSNRFEENTNIAVVTGTLIRDGYMSFTGGSISTEDGSYQTTLQIPFNRAISKGSGSITIEQSATGYRIPIVLTEAQYNRFRGIANFDTYYTRGTNGASTAGVADTSVKYVLNYNHIPSLIGDPSSTGTAVQQFAELFRLEESISINVNAAAVSLSADRKTLLVSLSGSNAPQVPGATYIVKYPANLVIDDLGNSSPAQPNVAAGENVALGGVARPFIRIRKQQDVITRNNTNTTKSTTTPSLTAAQPATAYVHMDSRTPSSTIQYTSNTVNHSVSAANWTLTGGPTAGTTISRPGTPATSFSSEITVTDATHSGIKYWVRARAVVTGQSNSYESDEIAYRTAITFRLRGFNNGGDMPSPGTTQGQRRIENSNQIWVRGGDSFSGSISTSVPGFPLTPNDDFNSLSSEGKRAGIRLMTKYDANNATPDNLINSTWRLLTWEINTDAYVEFLLGDDITTENLSGDLGVGSTYTQSTVQEAWQYGPRFWTAWRGGWTAQKTQFRVYPGDHRWIDIGVDTTATDQINFSAAWNGRGTRTVTAPNPNTN